MVWSEPKGFSQHVLSFYLDKQSLLEALTRTCFLEARVSACSIHPVSCTQVSNSFKLHTAFKLTRFTSSSLPIIKSGVFSFLPSVVHIKDYILAVLYEGGSGAESPGL